MEIILLKVDGGGEGEKGRELEKDGWEGDGVLLGVILFDVRDLLALRTFLLAIFGGEGE